MKKLWLLLFVIGGCVDTPPEPTPMKVDGYQRLRPNVELRGVDGRLILSTDDTGKIVNG